MGYLLVLGGSRSGKSGYALHRAEALAARLDWPRIYLATGVATDPEMADRIRMHQISRGSQWLTVEEPEDVAQWLKGRMAPAVVVLDCLSFLLNNWFMRESRNDEVIRQRADDLFEALAGFTYPLVVVSNEVGQGIVPGDSLSRQYRDYLGWMNQRAAHEALQVIWMVAGLPVDVRRLAPEW